MADNQKSVQFRFLQAGTASWYWAVDNFGIYSVPSQVITPPTVGPLAIGLQNGQAVISWTGGGTLQSADVVTGPWSDVGGATSPYQTAPSGTAKFYRLRQ
jgi:hypothetical protein